MTRPPTDFDALIFDMDGTLADTMPAHFTAWTTLANRYGFDLPEAKFYNLGGVPTFKIIRQLMAEAGRDDLDVHQLAEEKEALFVEGIDAVVEIEPVARIARAAQGSVPLAVATGGYRRVAEPLLTGLGMRGWFDALVTADDVTDHKPHPQTYLLAATQLGVDPTRCQAYEDTDLGVQSARAAGMDVVDVRDLLAAEAAL